MKMDIKRYKWPIIAVILIIAALSLMIAIGYPLGILSEDPDGLERVLIDSNGEPWIESLSSPWNPILSWIENNYLAGILGVIIVTLTSFAIFKAITHITNNKKHLKTI